LALTRCKITYTLNYDSNNLMKVYDEAGQWIMTFSLIINEDESSRKFIMPTKNLVIKPTYLFYNNEKKILRTLSITKWR
jgi:hypothetical protein